MIGRIVDFTIGLNRKQRITLELDGSYVEQYNLLKDTDLDIDIKKHREKRSLNANAYFHVLVNKIARYLGDGEELTKKNLVIDYGTLARDNEGKLIGFKLPANVEVDKIYPYAKCFDQRVEGGVKFCCYLVYKGTHEMDTAEMAKLIDGAIDVAKELGIETDTPAQLVKYKESWTRKEQTQ